MLILIPDILRSYHQNLGLFVTPAVGHGNSLLYQSFQPKADAGCRRAKALLGIVGSQHDHQKIYRLMAHQTGVNIIQS